MCTLTQMGRIDESLTNGYVSPDPKPMNIFIDLPFIEDVTKFAVEEMARQITLIDWGIFRSITLEEFLSYAWDSKNKRDSSTSVAKFTNQFNTISFWVIGEILKSNMPKRRAAVVSYFIKLAKKLHLINNIHSEFAILSALRSASIYRLERTWNLVPKRHKYQMEKLLKLFSETDNHSELRNYLNNIKLPCIPYTGLYLTDLVYINHVKEVNTRSPANKTRSSRPHDNWLSLTCSKTSQSQIDRILRILSEYQRSNYDFLYAPASFILDYLLALSEKGVSRSSLKFLESTYYARSLNLEPPALPPRAAPPICAPFFAFGSRLYDYNADDSLEAADNLNSNILGCDAKEKIVNVKSIVTRAENGDLLADKDPTLSSKIKRNDNDLEAERALDYDKNNESPKTDQLANPKHPEITENGKPFKPTNANGKQSIANGDENGRRQAVAKNKERRFTLEYPCGALFGQSNDVIEDVIVKAGLRSLPRGNGMSGSKVPLLLTTTSPESNGGPYGFNISAPSGNHGPLGHSTLRHRASFSEDRAKPLPYLERARLRIHSRLTHLIHTLTRSPPSPSPCDYLDFGNRGEAIRPVCISAIEEGDRRLNEKHRTNNGFLPHNKNESLNKYLFCENDVSQNVNLIPRKPYPLSLEQRDIIDNERTNDISPEQYESSFVTRFFSPLTRIVSPAVCSSRYRVASKAFRGGSGRKTLSRAALLTMGGICNDGQLVEYAEPLFSTASVTRSRPSLSPVRIINYTSFDKKTCIPSNGNCLPDHQFDTTNHENNMLEEGEERAVLYFMEGDLPPYKLDCLNSKCNLYVPEEGTPPTNLGFSERGPRRSLYSPTFLVQGDWDLKILDYLNEKMAPWQTYHVEMTKEELFLYRVDFVPYDARDTPISDEQFTVAATNPSQDSHDALDQSIIALYPPPFLVLDEHLYRSNIKFNQLFQVVPNKIAAFLYDRPIVNTFALLNQKKSILYIFYNSDLEKCHEWKGHFNEIYKNQKN
ncbi:uncharacterized protein LOC135931679 isoform X3 [Gordionus sp. m RMFG-2023]|uniref:uncharacterized protein LOC135931679 isoform X3 n=1 Tax=Gordionus sp. m RMFG-2023 TaxID=3053472 RepID=UPI0031FC50BA